MLTKSDLMSYAQCPRKLWLEKNQPQSAQRDVAAERRMREGVQVGSLARLALGPSVIWMAVGDDKEAAAETAKKILNDRPDTPAVEVPMCYKGVYARADALVPADRGYILQETKASSYPLNKDKTGPGKPDPHLVLDTAIQAWVMANSGIPFSGAELNLLDNRWRYPGKGDYSGLFRQLDITEEVMDEINRVPQLVEDARNVLASNTMPSAQTGKQCNSPHSCPFHSHCVKLDKPGPDHPIELLPDSAGKLLAKKLKEKQGYVSLLEPAPAELTGKAHDLYVRIQKAHRTGRAILEKGCNEAIDALPYPRYYFDFEGIDLAVPRWEGVRPYEQIPFQWSCHIEDAPGQFRHAEFLDLTGEDPSRGCIKAMLDTIDLTDNGPILVYFVTYERGRLQELAERHPEYAPQLEVLISRLVDLLPLVKSHYYHPDMRGSFSIKKVLPVIAPDLDYGELEGVQDGIGAQLAYIEAAFEVAPDSPKKAEIERNSLKYCRQDTWAMVEVAWFLAQNGRPTRPEDM